MSCIPPTHIIHTLETLNGSQSAPRERHSKASVSVLALECLQSSGSAGKWSVLILHHYVISSTCTWFRLILWGDLELNIWYQLNSLTVVHDG